MLPIYDEDEGLVPETQNLDEDEDLGKDEEEYGMEYDDHDEASDPKGKGGNAECQTWTKKQEEALAKAWVHFSVNKKQGNQQKSEGFWIKL
ncbi:hypothetical protein Hanom_Chr12g01142161 [Helianthus anomalus]